jgi:hypothetical protein
VHLGHWVFETRQHAWGMIPVLMVVGLGFIASIVLSDQLREIYVRFYAFLD